MTDPEKNGEHPTEIEDVENYTEERRLKSIFDIREQIHSVRQEVRVAAQSRNSRFQALCVYRALVDSYLLELEPLLHKYGDGEYYLQERDFGVIEVEPQVRQKTTNQYGGITTELYFPQKGEWKQVESKSIPDPDNIRLEGLRSLFQVPDPIVVTDSVWKGGRIGEGTSYDYRLEIQIPLQTLDSMLRVLNNFLSEIGFELEPKDETEPAQI